MKNGIVFFYIVWSAFLYGQSDNYSFIPKDLYFKSKRDSLFNIEVIDFNKVIFYNERGKELSKVRAVMQVNKKSNVSEFFFNNENKLKIVLIRAKTKKEKENERRFVDSLKRMEFLESTAPSFTLNLLNDSIFVFEPKQSANLYVLNFWFTNCSNCMTELRYLNKLVKKYEGENVHFIAVTFENKEKVTNFLKTKEFKYQQAISAIEAISKFEVSLYPVNLLIDRSGKIIFKSTGFTSETFYTLKKLISKHLN